MGIRCWALTGREIFLGLNGGHGTTASCHYSLSIEWVGHISCGKDAGKVGLCASGFGDNETCLICPDPGRKGLAVGVVAYGKEETVDGNVVMLFIGHALPPYYMCPFHTILAEQSHRIGLEEHLYFFVGRHTVCHA